MPVTLALLVLVVVLVLLARWLLVTKLPPADWGFTLSADAHGLGVTPEQVQGRPAACGAATFR
jgi:hypothetical protein